MSPIAFLQKEFEGGIVQADRGKFNPEVDEWRQIIGKYGVTGDYQTRPMETMSHGLQTRMVFCIMSLKNPHILLLDEPTNHLDLESLDAFLSALDLFEGAVVCVSHHRHFVTSFADELWIVRSDGPSSRVEVCHVDTIAAMKTCTSSPHHALGCHVAAMLCCHVGGPPFSPVYVAL